MRWYLLAAEQGDPSAQFNLGLAYDSGQGIVQDYVQAYKWLDLAATNFSPQQVERRNQAITKRYAVGAKMTPAQVAEAVRSARLWRPKSR